MSARYHFLYRWFDADGVLLYVGVTHQPVGREKAHLKSSWWAQFANECVVDAPTLSSRVDAELAESEAIAIEGPVFNRKGALDPYGSAAKYLHGLGLDIHDYLDHFPDMGRPLVENPRLHIHRIRLTAGEDALIKAAAEACGQDVAAWMRDRVLAAAKRVKKT